MYLRTSGFNSVVVAIGALVALACAALAPSATAASDAKYSPNPEARQFKTSAGGWTGSAGSDGLCLVVLTCPTINHRFVANGGARGTGGFIRVELGSLTGVGAISTSTFRSPVFTYNGVKGKRPDRLTFSMMRRAQVAALLDVAGNDATYSVSLRRTDGGARVELIEPTTLAAAKDWTSTGRVEVDPADVGIGKRYQLEITSRFSNGVQVIPSATVDYDNVVLYARDRDGDGGNGGGGGSVTNVEINNIAVKGLPGSAVLTKRGVVKVKLRCAAPKGNGGKCRFKRLKAMVKGKSQTKKRKARVPAGRARLVGLKTKSTKARKRIASRKRVKLVGKVTYGGKTRKVSRKVRVKAA